MKTKIVKLEAYKKVSEEIKKGKIAQIASDAFELMAEDTQPLEGYQEPDNFPECCNFHSTIYKHGQEIYADFPNCCEKHRKLKSVSWFRREDYAYLPLKLVRTNSYTWHFIEHKLDDLDWLKEISHYIDYTVKSYGQFPEGFGSPLGAATYLHHMEDRLEGDTRIPVEKREALLLVVRQYLTPSLNMEQAPDLVALDNIYTEWLKTFPFELSFFQHLKPFFASQRPLLEKIGEGNRYSGYVSATFKTQKGLLEFLNKLTDSILTEINVLKLHEQGRLSDVGKVQLELVLAERRHKIKQGYVNTSPDIKTRYRRILKHWLKDEKKFIKDLIPLLKVADANRTSDAGDNGNLPDSGYKPNQQPSITPETAEAFCEIVKPFFPPPQYADLKTLLAGGKKPKKKLLFRGNGNMLADAFKQLMDAHLIVGCNKAQLQSWIMRYFQYQYRGDTKDFTARYLKDIISTDKDKCTKPIINVVLDKATGRYTIQQS